ncbi:hypothetical protein MKW98_011604 [Papaver atlanticum]|uniref:adenylate kinase n=1 Tax=Papaver atlanticum TaxID=357466 RepID=A0AAD4S3L8_9MAGN|nr:hypothetical protein MKW98_011604 [Papaver atlanticum]
MGRNSLSDDDDLTIIFVLGGPGSGKGTQCKMIAHKYDEFCHISVGDLLRTEQESGTMIRNCIKEARRVPSGIVVDLIIQAMERSGKKKFLIDGFPCSVENLMAFCSVPKFVLYLSCSEEVMVQRALRIEQGREDDNPETIRKQIKFFEESSLPVIEYYCSAGILEEINSEMSVEEVFKEITKVFELL